jgi:hypothetical protein
MGLLYHEKKHGIRFLISLNKIELGSPFVLAQFILFDMSFFVLLVSIIFFF